MTASIATGARGMVINPEFTQNGGDVPSGRPTSKTPDDDGQRRLMHINNHITSNTSHFGDDLADSFAPSASLGEILHSPDADCNETYDRLSKLKVLQLLWYFKVPPLFDREEDYSVPPDFHREIAGPGVLDFHPGGGAFNPRNPTPPPPPVCPPPPVLPEPTSAGMLCVLSLAALVRRPRRVE